MNTFKVNHRHNQLSSSFSVMTRRANRCVTNCSKNCLSCFLLQRVFRESDPQPAIRFQSDISLRDETGQWKQVRPCRRLPRQCCSRGTEVFVQRIFDRCCRTLSYGATFTGNAKSVILVMITSKIFQNLSIET